MNDKWNGIKQRISLRSAAEAMVGNLSPSTMEANPSEVLLHELLVHKIELEMQNEELRRAHSELEEARDRYADLYEFAPFAYININREGQIKDINLTGATILGGDRAKLIKNRFAQFVGPEDKDRWNRLFMNMMQITKFEKQEFSLVMAKLDGTLFNAYLNCLRKSASDVSSILRITLVDIDRIKAEELDEAMLQPKT